MKKAIIYGAGTRGKQVALHIQLDYEILGFIDSDVGKHNTQIIIEDKSYNVFAPKQLTNMEFDMLFIGTYAIKSVQATLDSLHIPHSFPYKTNN